jgi:hypothetical protein
MIHLPSLWFAGGIFVGTVVFWLSMRVVDWIAAWIVKRRKSG